VRITKYNIATDPQNRLVSYGFERLFDDGHGHTHVINRTVAIQCRSCGSAVPADHPVAPCDWCGFRPLCPSCLSSGCAVCNRKLCRRCRRGFVWGSTPINTCAACFQRLNRRAIFEQRQALRQAALTRYLQRQQGYLHALAARAQLLRMGMGPARQRGFRRVR